jgi:6-pyruvoyltetrahydropterin/6-carboxytetrahydropterin synthase
MNKVYITRRETFNAAHKLWQPTWSDEKNNEVFGRCANKNWHGHNFVLFVTVCGDPDPETGFVMNLKDLSTIIKQEVTEKLDHKNLNLDVPFLEGIMTSTEHSVIASWKILEPKIAEYGAELSKLKLVETENNFVEYFGGKQPY